MQYATSEKKAKLWIVLRDLIESGCASAAEENLDGTITIRPATEDQEVIDVDA